MSAPLSWSAEVCAHCKGYPKYPACTCTPEVIAKRGARRNRSQILGSGSTTFSRCANCAWDVCAQAAACLRQTVKT